MKIVILGGGISGLSAAWFARKKHPDAQITLIEKAPRLGGWIQTSREGGLLFEKGPRTFQASRCAHLLDLIREVGLEEEILFSDPCAKKRYLWSGGRLRSLASFLPWILPALLLEPFKSKKTLDDESIYDFAARKFGSRIASTLFDAITLGIYAGDIRKLSMRSCFPSLFFKEGSLLFSRSRKKSSKKGLFTLRGGMDLLIDRLAEKSRIEIVCNATVEAIEPNGVRANGIFYPAGQILSALPGSAIGRLTGLWSDFPETDLWVVQLAYEGAVLPKKGFGYLVPTQEGEKLLGMVWDSAIFPQQNVRGETRVTGMMREGSVASLREVVQRHLGVSAEPIFSSATLARGAIPQFHVGYWKRLAQFEREVKAQFPAVTLLGSYLQGPSVDTCVALAASSLA